MKKIGLWAMSAMSIVLGLATSSSAFAASPTICNDASGACLWWGMTRIPAWKETVWVLTE